MPGYAYLDASAVVKLVVAEPESGPLERDILERDGLISSAVVTTEVRRAAARVSRRLTQQAGEVLEALVLSHVTRAILDRAAALQPAVIRDERQLGDLEVERGGEMNGIEGAQLRRLQSGRTLENRPGEVRQHQRFEHLTGLLSEPA